MTYIDFAIIDTDINENKAKDILKYIIDTPIVNSITVPFYFIKLIKPYLDKEALDFSCFVDYPLGISDIKTRNCAIEQAVNSGFNTIDISMPQNFAANRKYDKIRDDIKSVLDINNNKANIRYILEYRKFDHHCLKKICEIFDTLHIEYVFPSTGYFLDNLADNILASIFLYQNSKDLKIISTGNIWQSKHFETLIKSGLFGFRTTSIHTLNNFLQFNLDRKKNSGV